MWFEPQEAFSGGIRESLASARVQVRKAWPLYELAKTFEIASILREDVGNMWSLDGMIMCVGNLACMLKYGGNARHLNRAQSQAVLALAMGMCREGASKRKRSAMGSTA